MILYVDSSALVKRYVREAESATMLQTIELAESIGTALITRAEIAATFAKTVRMGLLTRERAQAELETFRAHWSDLVRIEMTESLIARADAFAWQHGLRGYDAVHLSAGVLWREALDTRVTFATFDKRLWIAARQVGLEPFPPELVED